MKYRRVLIVKTSSLGDVLHTLPAVTDAESIVPGIRFDWVVEEALSEIPAWHAAVDRVIPVATRRWRKRFLWSVAAGEWARFRRRLRSRVYDYVIDAQGLMKSAAITRMALGVRCGLDRASAREPLLGLAYHQRYSIPKGRHAIDRIRQLFANVLGYTVPAGPPEYGIDRNELFWRASSRDYVVFLHGTTWSTKHWPESYWIELARLAEGSGFEVYLPWGNEEEQARALRIAGAVNRSLTLPRLDLLEMASVLSGAHAVVGVDTGLGHLAAALNVPVATIYGATDPRLTGTRGGACAHLRARANCSPCLNRRCIAGGPAATPHPCYATLPPHAVWSEVERITPRPREAVNQ